MTQQELFRSASQGIQEAQYSLSKLLQANGDENLAEAVDWLRKSALQGFAPAQYLYSLYCESGTGMAPNPAEALRFSQLAACQDYCPAARLTASMLEQGIGVLENHEQAFHWYFRAAELGDADSAASIGRMYANGAGVEKDISKALEWFREGQKRGSPRALLALSSVYRFGELGQDVDARKADELAAQADQLIQARARAIGRVNPALE